MKKTWAALFFLSPILELKSSFVLDNFPCKFLFLISFSKQLWVVTTIVAFLEFGFLSFCSIDFIEILFFLNSFVISEITPDLSIVENANKKVREPKECQNLIYIHNKMSRVSNCPDRIFYSLTRNRSHMSHIKMRQEM